MNYSIAWYRQQHSISNVDKDQHLNNEHIFVNTLSLQQESPTFLNLRALFEAWWMQPQNVEMCSNA